MLLGQLVFALNLYTATALMLPGLPLQQQSLHSLVPRVPPARHFLGSLLTSNRRAVSAAKSSVAGDIDSEKARARIWADTWYPLHFERQADKVGGRSCRMKFLVSANAPVPAS